jgi:hypothetical protein
MSAKAKSLSASSGSPRAAIAIMHRSCASSASVCALVAQVAQLSDHRERLGEVRAPLHRQVPKALVKEDGPRGAYIRQTRHNEVQRVVIGGVGASDIVGHFVIVSLAKGLVVSVNRNARYAFHSSGNAGEIVGYRRLCLDWISV